MSKRRIKINQFYQPLTLPFARSPVMLEFPVMCNFCLIFATHTGRRWLTLR